MERELGSIQLEVNSRDLGGGSNWGNQGSGSTYIAEELRSMSYELIHLTTSEQVYDYLKIKGVKGKRKSITSCPLANLAAKTHGSVTLVEVDPNGLTMKIEPVIGAELARYSGFYVDKNGNMEVQMTYTPALTQFVQDFDNGLYPEMEEECSTTVATTKS